MTSSLSYTVNEVSVTLRYILLSPTVHRHGLPTSRYSYLMSSDRKGYKLPYRDVVKVKNTWLCVLMVL